MGTFDKHTLNINYITFIVVYMKIPFIKLAAFAVLTLIFLCSCSEEGKKSATEEPPTELRLITHNVWYGFTEVPGRKDQWLDWMRKQEPDVVALQELNEYTAEKLANDAKSWGHSHSALLKTEGFPTGITSRYPITDIQRTMEGFHHGLMRVQIKGIWIYVIHLHPGDWETRYREAGLILEDIERLPADARVVLAGDFNALSPLDSTHYARTGLESFFRQRDNSEELDDNNLNGGRLDYSVIGRILDAGFTDLSYRYRPEEYNFTGSFPTSVEKEGNHGDYRRLDYVFVTENILENVTGATLVSDDTTRILSDHLPVVVDFRLEKNPNPEPLK